MSTETYIKRKIGARAITGGMADIQKGHAQALPRPARDPQRHTPLLTSPVYIKSSLSNSTAVPQETKISEIGISGWRALYN